MRWRPQGSSGGDGHQSLGAIPQGRSADHASAAIAMKTTTISVVSAFLSALPAVI